MAKIFIGIPTVDGKVTAELMIRMLNWSSKYSSNIIIETQPFTVPHDHARNVLVKKFLASDATYFMGIDADVVPPEDAIIKMIAADKDVITGITKRFAARKDGYDLAPMTFEFERNRYNIVYNFSKQPVVKIDGCGAGCFLVKREVFEKIKCPYKFKYDKDGIVTRSEDLYFCDQLRKNKFELWADYSINCKHIKSIDVNTLK